MSETNLSPVNYLSKVFGQTCQDVGLSPQDVMNLLLFQFMQIQPERREVILNSLKMDFRKFSQAADFKGCLDTINGAIDKEELKLYNWLLNFQEESGTLLHFAPKNQPERDTPRELK